MRLIIFFMDLLIIISVGYVLVLAYEAGKLSSKQKRGGTHGARTNRPVGGRKANR